MKIGRGVSELWRVENLLLPLTWPWNFIHSFSAPCLFIVIIKSIFYVMLWLTVSKMHFCFVTFSRLTARPIRLMHSIVLPRSSRNSLLMAFCTMNFRHGMNLTPHTSDTIHQLRQHMHLTTHPLHEQSRMKLHRCHLCGQKCISTNTTAKLTEAVTTSLGRSRTLNRVRAIMLCLLGSPNCA